MPPIEPGTYRIGSEASGTAMTSPDWNEWDVVCWHKHDGRNQQWFVQRSGEGFRIKNCVNGHYLAVSRVSNNAPVYCGRYPTTWVLNQTNEGTHTIKCGDDDRVIDLDGWGKGHDGNHMHLHWQGSWMAHRRWWFERLSDDTGEEEPKLRQEIDTKKKQLGDCDAQLAKKDRCIAQLTEQLVEKDQELSQVKDDLAEKLFILAEIQEALHQTNESLTSQKAELAQIRAENANGRQERELAQQKEETSDLRNKMEGFERLFMQMMRPDTARPNNMT
ncbi:hypothetical protein FS749_000495 [Ceratobasidium sp. UAMH 11750]|nr:hypothetical protein FS749_000495 [Ceratobasidium sp. UAMH 11750]